MPRPAQFTPIADPPDHVLAAARVRFETGQADLAQMARDFGMAVSTLKLRIRHRWKWRLRRRRTPRGKSGQAVQKRLNGSVRSMLTRELAKLETEFSALPEDGDVERTTKVLASLVRILVAMARLDAPAARQPKQEPHADTEPPVDLARLRHDLARRLGAAEPEAAAAADAGEPERA
jgi:hypothetical protein